MNDETKVERISNKHRNRKKSRKIFYIFSGFAIVIFFLVVAYENFFNVVNILADGDIENHGYLPSEVIEVSGINKGDNLFEIKQTDVEKNVKSKYSYIKSVKISKEYPATVKITVVEEEGKMYIHLGRDYFIISSNGDVLECVQNPNFSQMTKCEIVSGDVFTCICGEKLKFKNEETLGILLEVFHSLEKAEIEDHVTVINAEDKYNILLSFENRFDVVYGSYDDGEIKAKLIKEVLDNEVWIDSVGTIDVQDGQKAYVKVTGKVGS